MIQSEFLLISPVVSIIFWQEPAASSWCGCWASMGSVPCTNLQGRGSADYGCRTNGQDVKGHWQDGLHWPLCTSDLRWTTGTQTCLQYIKYASLYTTHSPPEKSMIHSQNMSTAGSFFWASQELNLYILTTGSRTNCGSCCQMVPDLSGWNMKDWMSLTGQTQTKLLIQFNNIKDEIWTFLFLLA